MIDTQNESKSDQKPFMISLFQDKNTITNVDKLIEEIFSGEKKGYAIDMEESEYNVACIAAPVIGNDGKVVAAVSISGLVSNIIPPQ